MAIHRSIRDQLPREQVFWRYVTGWPSQIEGRLHRKMGALQRHGAAHLKIGITNDPVRRWREGYRHHGWVQMHVIYKSDSHGHICDLERHMIERFESGLMTSPGRYYNARGGGGGPKPHNSPYYLYLVTAPRYARITT